MTNSADPDQLASSEAKWSGPTLFAKTGHVVFSKRRVNLYWIQSYIFSQQHIFCNDNTIIMDTWHIPLL